MLLYLTAGNFKNFRLQANSSDVQVTSCKPLSLKRKPVVRTETGYVFSALEKGFNKLYFERI